MQQSEFLNYLSNELDLYYQMPDTYSQVKFEKKQYIDGLMKASRLFGVSYESLKERIDNEVNHQNTVYSASGTSGLQLEIPSLASQKL